MGTETAASLLAELRAHAHPDVLPAMARYGINTSHMLGGISTPYLRALARRVGKEHALARELWRSGVQEARTLACFIDDPARVTEAQMERWVRDFDSWDICDACCGNLFDRTPFAWSKAVEWSARRDEFVKRAGFVLMADLAVHDKAAPDRAFTRFFPIIKRESNDTRNFVRKAVNWALRSIGKRNENLRRLAIRTGEQIAASDNSSAHWIASDALRELRARSL